MIARTRRFRFRIRMNTIGSLAGKVRYWSMSWDDRSGADGEPTAANLARYIKAWEDSCGPTGANKHIGLDPVVSAEVVDMESKSVMATFSK